MLLLTLTSYIQEGLGRRKGVKNSRRRDGKRVIRAVSGEGISSGKSDEIEIQNSFRCPWLYLLKLPVVGLQGKSTTVLLLARNYRERNSAV